MISTLTRPTKKLILLDFQNFVSLCVCFLRNHGISDRYEISNKDRLWSEETLPAFYPPGCNFYWQRLVNTSTMNLSKKKLSLLEYLVLTSIKKLEP